MARGENVFRRKDGRYEARYPKGRKGDGTLLYGFCYGRTYEEAKEKADRARREVQCQEWPGRPEDKENTVKLLCDSWLLAQSTRLKPASHAKYSASVRNHIVPFFGDRTLWEIRAEDVDRFTQTLLHEKKLAVKTVRDILTLLHSILSRGMEQSEQRLQSPRITYPREYRKTVRVLDEKEESALAGHLSRDMDLSKLGVYLALRTGMRIGEVCALRWCDISFEDATITVRHTAQRIPRGSRSEGEEGKTGKAQKETGVGQKKAEADGARTAMVIGTPKSDSSFRLIPLMPDMEALCSRFHSTAEEAFVLTGTDKCMDPRTLQRHLKKYLEACGIQAAHFHTLRHTFATRCVEVGFDVKTLSEILGHSNVNITLNRYVHPDLELKRRNMERLKALISP